VIIAIEITRFRGIREGKLDGFTPLVVLVGPNGCGKTSVLDALLVGGSREIEEGIGQAVRRHQGVKYGARWLFWRPSQSQSCQITVRMGAIGQRTCELMTLHTRNRDDLGIRCTFNDTFGEQRKGKIDLRFARGNAFKRADEGLFGVRRPAPPGEDFTGVRLAEPGREDPSVPLHDLVTKATERGALGLVRSMIAEIVPGAEDIRILTEANEPLVHIVYHEHSVPAALAGDGIYSLMRLSLELAARPKGTVLLEEPEVHQHPGAIRQTMRAVLAAVRRDIQVILTTHSLELIDALLAESSEEDLGRLSLYRLQLEDGVLISHRMSGPDVSFARTQIENDLR
jgi:predicted ATPase